MHNDISYLLNISFVRAILGRANYGDGIPLTRPPVLITGLIWPVLILDSHIKIGCELHPTTEWAAFDMADIAKMEDKAEGFWTKYKDLILLAAKLHQNS